MSIIRVPVVTSPYTLNWSVFLCLESYIFFHIVIHTVFLNILLDKADFGCARLECEARGKQVEPEMVVFMYLRNLAAYYGPWSFGG